MSWSRNTQLKVLMILVVSLLVSVIWNFAPHPISGSAVIQSEESNSRSTGAVSDELPAVGLLQKESQSLEDIKRNIFEFESDQDSRTETGDSSQASAAASLPEPVEIHFLGLYEEKGANPKRLAAVSNGGKIYVGGVGQTIAGKYKVLKIEDEFLVVRLLTTQKVFRFPLGRRGTPVEIREDLPPEEKSQ